MNARVHPAKMEAHAQTMLTPTHAPVGLALLASTVKPTSLTVLKGECVCLSLSFAISHGVLNKPAGLYDY